MTDNTLFDLDEYTEKPAYGYDDYGDDLAELLEELDDIGAEFCPHTDAFYLDDETAPYIVDSWVVGRHLLANDLPDAPPYIPARHEKHDLATRLITTLLLLFTGLFWTGVVMFFAWLFSLGGAG